MREIDELKRQAIAEVDRRAARSGGGPDDRAEPGAGPPEHTAVKTLTGLLADGEIESEVGIAGLATAWWAQIGGGRRPTIAILAEFDALPNIGHGCGQPDRAFGRRALDSLKTVADLYRTIVILGTPAEESTVDNSGGKVHLIWASAFDECRRQHHVPPEPVHQHEPGGLAGSERRRLHLPRQGGARLASPLGGDQRPGRRAAHLQRHQRAAPARQAGDQDPRRRHGWRRRPERRAPARPPAAFGSARRMPRSWSRCSVGWSSARRAAR